ncbi:uncharacterized protein LOC107360649 [Tetranychus urticae]|uniref:Uncharacterized protein n=1 Tax=Tetranychus urticae TaxID=32264 RepID=T1K5H3_TETUR|nr:uncharacterized protein LOC107360649 [Tetranychus urticae]
MSKDECKRPSEDSETTVKKMKTKNEPNKDDGKTRPREEDNDQNCVQAKKIKLEKIVDEWNLGMGYTPRRISKLNIQKQEFFDYISTHKALSTTNLLDIRGYGNLTRK